MRITINGEVEQVTENSLTVARLLEIKAVESPDMVSVQINGKIIDRAQYEAASLSENDTVDFLYFMGGGACA